MSIVSGYPKRRRTGRTGDFDARLRRDYEEVWLVLTTTPKDGPFAVINAPGIPARYQPYSEDGAALCVHAAPRLSGDDNGTGTLWEVVCKYSTAYDVLTQPENPIARPPRFSMSQNRVTRPVVWDNGLEFGRQVAVVNIAGDPYNPPAEREDSELVIQVRRNEATLPFLAMAVYKDAVNSDSWNGANPRTCKISGISSGEIQYENGYQFYEVNYAIHYRPETWDFVICQMGYNGLKWETATKKVKFPIGDGTTPKLLYTGNPAPAAGNVIATWTDNADLAEWKRHRVYPEQPFSALGLTLPPGQ